MVGGGEKGVSEKLMWGGVGTRAEGAGWGVVEEETNGQWEYGKTSKKMTKVGYSVNTLYFKNHLNTCYVKWSTIGHNCFMVLFS